MQTPDLSACLPSSPDGGVLLLKDTLQASGAFVVQALLRRALQAGDQVVLLALEQSLDKYKYCMKKMGVPLQPYLDSGRLSVVGAHEAGLAGPDVMGDDDAADALKRVYRLLLRALTLGDSSGIHSSGEQGIPQQQQRQQQQGDITTSSSQSNAAVRDGSTDAARGQADSGGTELCSSSGVTVILDGVSLLAGMGCRRSDWLTFLHLCTSLGRRVEPRPCTCVLLAHADVPDDLHWLRYMQHMAEVVIDVTPLEARMADIDGTVTVTRRGLPRGGSTSGPGQYKQAALQQGSSIFERQEALEAVRSLYFRAGETGVRWIAQVATSDLL